METKDKAAFFCDGKKCFSSYDCGVDKPLAFHKFGKDTNCPLEKYGMPENMKVMPTDPLQAWKAYPSRNTMLDYAHDICEECEHVYARAEDAGFEEFQDHCCDCPIYKTEENIYEALAEAACS